jgi:hypothetical protein
MCNSDGSCTVWLWWLLVTAGGVNYDIISSLCVYYGRNLPMHLSPFRTIRHANVWLSNMVQSSVLLNVPDDC